jgi:hypothetical protein
MSFRQLRGVWPYTEDLADGSLAEVRFVTASFETTRHSKLSEIP